jgi:hypothetical protein
MVECRIMEIAAAEGLDIFTVNHVRVRHIAAIVQDKDNALHRLRKNILKVLCPVDKDTHHSHRGPFLLETVVKWEVDSGEDVPLILGLFTPGVETQ